MNFKKIKQTQQRRGLYKTGWNLGGVSQGDLYCTVAEIERTPTQSHVQYLEITSNKHKRGYGMSDYLKFLPTWVDTHFN